MAGPTTTRVSSNRNLHSAKRAKNDEFYTQLADIESEMNAYLEYDPDVFRGKTILLPCDDHNWSNFWTFFNDRFEQLGLTRLVATGYVTGGRGVFAERTGDRTTTDLLDGDGDFRSPEVTALRDEADLVITNPPFSLFRAFVAWLMDGDKKCLILRNMNAITHKDVFPLIQNNQMWVGTKRFGGGMDMIMPSSTFDKEQAGNHFVDKNGRYIKNVMGVIWFTNIEHGRRHEPLQLMTEADNTRFSKHKNVRGVGYQTYDNLDAIEVPRVDAIPSDYPGVMGVPITFLGKFNPDQFEILGYPDGKVGPSQWVPRVNGKNKYARILIRHRNPQAAAAA